MFAAPAGHFDYGRYIERRKIRSSSLVRLADNQCTTNNDIKDRLYHYRRTSTILCGRLNRSTSLTGPVVLCRFDLSKRSSCIGKGMERVKEAPNRRTQEDLHARSGRAYDNGTKNPG